MTSLLHYIVMFEETYFLIIIAFEKMSFLHHKTLMNLLDTLLGEAVRAISWLSHSQCDQRLNEGIGFFRSHFCGTVSSRETNIRSQKLFMLLKYWRISIQFNRQNSVDCDPSSMIWQFHLFTGFHYQRPIVPI